MVGESVGRWVSGRWSVDLLKPCISGYTLVVAGNVLQKKKNFSNNLL